MIVYEDEASFRQTPTLYRTWARRGCQPQIPTRGERNTQKVLGAVSVPTGDFVWRHQTEYFNAQTYLSFVEGELLPHFYRRRHRVFLIQDNASYHKKPEVLDFFAKHAGTYASTRLLLLSDRFSEKIRTRIEGHKP